MTNNQAEKKIDIAIDKMLDLKDDGRGCDKLERILDLLNELYGEIKQ